MMDAKKIKELKTQVENFGCKSIGLYDVSNGEYIIPCNPPTKAADLDYLYKLIPTLPDGRYHIMCKTNPKHSGFKVPFEIGNPPEETMLSADSEKRAQPGRQFMLSENHMHEFGELQAEVARLKAENLHLLARCEQLETDLADAENELEEAGQLSEKPSITSQIMEGLAPHIPRLADMLISKMDKAPEPPATLQAPPAEPMQIDYEKLADAILQKEQFNGQQH